MVLMKKGKIYTVHYGTDISPTLQFVNSVKGFLGDDLEVVIINNSKEIDLSGLISDHVYVVTAEENLGYFRAVKHGTEKYPVEGLDYIIICNNDIEIKDKEFFNILESKLDDYDIIAPSIKTLAGVEQNPHHEKKPALARKIFYRIYFSNYIFSFILNNLIVFKNNFFKSKETVQNERLVYSPHGAFMILKTSFFKAGGYIIDESFLYGEEDSIAAMAEKFGLITGFVPSLKVIHSESVVIGKLFTFRNYKHQKEGYKHTLKKFPSVYSIWK
jgi:GT2 family glycosyltransferase